MTEVIQKIKLVDGPFTPSEASDVISALIDEKINFHKTQRWSLSIRDESADMNHLTGRVAALQKEKANLKKIIARARAEGYNLRINGTLEITLEK